MAIEFELVPPGTRAQGTGEGQPIDARSSATHTFLCRLEITDVIEQESLDVSIWGSENGEAWGQKPILKFPQRFYRGQTRMVLDLTLRPEVKFIKARWETNRWGRVAPVPKFEFGLHAAEIPVVPKPSTAEAAAARN